MVLSRLLIVAIALLCSATLTSRADGPPQQNFVKSLDVVVKRLVEDPARHRIYGSATDSNQVVVIDADTLTITKKIATGLAPVGLAISPDGSTLYVALSGVAKIGVIDLGTLTTRPGINIPFKPWQIVAGQSDRLYVTPSALDGSKLLQVDAKTGQNSVVDQSTEAGFVQISPDGNTLYYGNTGLSPSTLERFDVSSATPVLLQSLSGGDAGGGSGVDLKLSHGGGMLCYPNGSGNGGGPLYSTTVFNPSNLAVRKGTFPQGDGYPGALAFSPDDQTMFEHRSFTNRIFVYNTATFKERATLPVPNDEVADLVTDPSGRYLLVADGAAIEIYDLYADITTKDFATLGYAYQFQAPIYIAAQTITATGIPAGLKFDKATQTISGTPTEDGVFPIKITANDGTRTVTVDLTLTLYPDARPQNISTRGMIGTGEDVLIAGFIVTGNYGEEVVLRGMGPSLNVAGRLSNPAIELHDATGAVIGSNDDYYTDPQGYVLNNVGLAPEYSEEAGLYRRLEPGSYTLVVHGAGDTSGIGLAELYDLGALSQVSNLSTRGRVQTGDKVMIGGVIVTGTTQAKMVLRAIGPSLQPPDVTSPLEDPQLELFDGQGTQLAFNDNWRSSQESEIQSTGLAPANDAEAAIAIALAPGGYTAVVSGVGDTSGVALFEAYNLP